MIASVLLNLSKLKNLFESRLNLLNSIYDDIHPLIEEKSKYWNQEYAQHINDIKGLSGKLPQQLPKNFHGNVIKYTLYFAQITIHSFFISAYSIFENYLSDIGEEVENHSDYRVKIDDFAKAKSDLDKVRKYLDLIHGLRSALPENSIWQKILRYKKIRNVLVHDGGVIKKLNERENLEIFLKAYDVNITPDGKIFIVDIKFLNDFVTDVSQYCRGLIDDVSSLPLES